jgi:replicative DNA helicase
MIHTIEDYIINGLLKHATYTKKYIKNIKADFFGPKEQKIAFNAIFKEIKDTKKIPSKEQLLIRINEIEKNPDIAASACKYISGLQVTYAANEDFSWLCHKTARFIERKNIELNLIHMVAALEKEDFDFDKQLEAFKNCKMTMVDEEPIRNIEDGAKNYLDNVTQITEKLSSGFKWIDWALDGGFQKKQVSVFLSETNIGKTTLLTSIFTNMFRQNLNCLFVSLEEPTDVIYGKVIASITKIPISQHRERVNELKTIDFHFNDSSIYSIPDGSNTNELELLIMEWQNKTGQKLDVLVVDYIGCFRNGKDASLYENGGKVAEEFNNISQKYDCSIITAAQLNRSAYSSDAPDKSNISNSMMISHKAHNMFILTGEKDLQDEKTRILKLLLDKSRVSGKNQCWCELVFRKSINKIEGATEEEIANLRLGYQNPNNKYLAANTKKAKH